MTAIWPIEYHWSGEAMIPQPRHMARAKHQYVEGEIYRLENVEERSTATHNHFFASLHELYTQLPEDVADRFINIEHFRKWCLIKCGYASEQTFVLQDHNEAMVFAALFGRYEPYAVIIIGGQVVKIYIAESQSRKAMGAKRFQESKTAILDLASSLVGVTREQAEGEGKHRRHVA